jgi:hypothetical protein
MLMKKSLITLALVALASAFAAPTFTFVKDAAMNGKMMAAGGKEVIELAAMPGISLRARNVAPTHAIFFYTSKNQLADAQAIYEFYEGALLQAGWKGHDAMMMEKDGAMMEKKDGAMMDKKDGAAMEKKDGAMMEKKDGAMMDKGAMMGGKFETALSMNKYTLVLKVQPRGADQIEVDIVLQ